MVFSGSAFFLFMFIAKAFRVPCCTHNVMWVVKRVTSTHLLFLENLLHVALEH